VRAENRRLISQMDLDEEFQMKLMIEEKLPTFQATGDIYRVRKPFGVDLPQPLCDPTMFKTYQVLLSGSAAVKHFFPHDTWHCNDIDLFTFTDLNTVCDYLRGHQWVPALSGPSPTDLGLCDDSQSTSLSKGHIRVNVTQFCCPHGHPVTKVTSVPQWT